MQLDRSLTQLSGLRRHFGAHALSAFHAPLHMSDSDSLSVHSLAFRRVHGQRVPVDNAVAVHLLLHSFCYSCLLQSCMKPATDIFISSQQMVASIVVLPLMYGEQNLGGLYFTLETPSNFQNIKDMLMGFVNSIVLVLLQKLEGQLHQMWDVVVQVGLYCAWREGRGLGFVWSTPVRECNTCVCAATLCPVWTLTACYCSLHVSLCLLSCCCTLRCLLSVLVRVGCAQGSLLCMTLPPCDC